MLLERLVRLLCCLSLCSVDTDNVPDSSDEDADKDEDEDEDKDADEDTEDRLLEDTDRFDRSEGVDFVV